VDRNWTPRGQLVDGLQDVAGGERYVLRARAVVELQVLVDLALALAGRRFVERELDPVVAVGDHLAHQRRVLGGDVVADELRHIGEPHHPLVELHPLVHPAELDVAHHVVNRLEQPLRRSVRLDVRRGGSDIAGPVGTLVAGPVDESVPRVAVGRDRA
jgi:hypothetical protein